MKRQLLICLFAAVTASAIHAQSIDWSSEGTFDASALPAGTATNTFSDSSVFDFEDVEFSHTVGANEDLSELALSAGSFSIHTASGDSLSGSYNDFIYTLTADGTNYDGVGSFEITGGTGMYSGATGRGNWSAVAAFTSTDGGTADHEWMGSLVLPEIVFNWTSEGTFDASSLPAGSAVNTFSDASAFNFVDVEFNQTVAANDDLSVLTLSSGAFSITAGNGDTLRGSYDDFVYTLQPDSPVYDGVGDFTFTGGTGVFAGATGSGSWQALAQFTSDDGGTADHVWSGNLLLVPEPSCVWCVAVGLIGLLIRRRCFFLARLRPRIRHVK